MRSLGVSTALKTACPPVKAVQYDYGETSGLTLRLALAGALWRWAAHSPWPLALTGAAWVLGVTTVGLALLPWRWHQRFAARSVPRALPHLRAIGAASTAMGAALLAAVVGARPIWMTPV